MAINAYVSTDIIEANATVEKVINAEGIAANVNLDVNHKPFTGPYTITPSSDAVVLETNGRKMTANVIIEPIPNNYGLITWNGSVLTVS